jgi:hypothetical protein
MEFNIVSLHIRLIQKGKPGRNLNRNHIQRFVLRIIWSLLLVSLVLSDGGGAVTPVQAQRAGAGANTSEIVINTGKYQIPADLLVALQARLLELGDRSGNATSFGVGYYEEHVRWAWIELLVANGDDFKEAELGPSFQYFASKDESGWSVVFSEDDQEFRAALDAISREGLSLQDAQSLAGYYQLNRPDSSAGSLTGDLLFPWSSTQNSWRFSSYGYHAAGFESLGMEKNSEAIDLLPPASAQPARVLAMQGGTVVKKLECTWNTVLIVRHDGYPDPKRFLYLHIQNGTSPVGTGTVIQKGQYLGDLRTPVFNGYSSNGSCTSQGSGAFTCERDVNPSTQSLCSYSNARHLHLGFGTDRSIAIDGNVVGDLVLGATYKSSNLDTTVTSFDDAFAGPTLDARWHWYNEDSTHWSLTVAPGSLRIVTQPKDISGSTNTAPLLLQSLQSYIGQDFDLQTRVAIAPAADDQQAGLIVYGGYDDYVSLTYAYSGAPGFLFTRENAGASQSIAVPAPAGTNDIYLRIIKLGKTYFAYTGKNGTDWTFLGRQENVAITPSEVGLLAYNGANGSSTEIPADFDSFKFAAKLPVFGDVTSSHPYYPDIEILYANGLTGGCSLTPLKFCPDQIMNRAQAAVFMMRGTYGSAYLPPTDQANLFQDNWSPGTWAQPWAEAMRAINLTSGCKASPLLYCPWIQLPREQAMIFALKMKYGNDFKPPPATGNVFADMSNPNYYATAWAEQAYADGLIADCGTSEGKPKICPKTLATRGLGAYMIVRAKNLSMP